MASLPESAAAIRERWERDGFVVVRRVFTDKALLRLRERMGQILDTVSEEELLGNVFSTGEKQLEEKKHDYFLTSSDKIRCFLEEKSVSADGKLTRPKRECINKVAHNLAELDDVFREFTSSVTMKELAQAIGVPAPVIVQSMYIMKQPYIGGEVRPHQDATFLYTTPETLAAFWLPIDNAKIENACLWAVPGSHKTELKTRMKLTAQRSLVFEPPTNTLTWPEDDAYVPMEVDRGDVVLMHGRLIHKSGENASSMPRHAYTFHVMNADSEWSKENWLQRSTPFPAI